MSFGKRKRDHETTRQGILDTIIKIGHDKDAKKNFNQRKIKELQEEISKKEQEVESLIEDIDKIEKGIVQDNISRLKKDKKVLEQLLKFTKSEWNQIKDIKSNIAPRRLQPQYMDEFASAYDSILAAAPSRLFHAPRIAKSELRNYDEYFLGQVVNNISVIMIGANAVLDFEDDNVEMYYKIGSSKFRIKRNGIFYRSNKLMIDFDLIFNVWERRLLDHLCKDVVLIILGYLHGDIKFPVE